MTMSDYKLINDIAQIQIESIKDHSSHNEPLVVVRCITYNHELYIKDALEGFVSQKTTFPFIVIVHDDASNDKTASIIKEYAERFPEIIFPIIEENNQYSLHNGSLGKILRAAVDSTGAKYVAMCEGDDYWTDPDKLQMQVDFLESHPDYSMCCHRVDVLNENTGNIDTGCTEISDRDYDHCDIQGKLSIPTCSTVLRTECLLNMPQDNDFIVGDNVLWATCRSMGKVRGFEKSMGVYRRVESGWTAQTTHLDKERYYKLQLSWIKHYEAMKRYFPTVDRNIFDNLICEYQACVTYVDLIKYHSNLFPHFKQFFGDYRGKYLSALIKLVAKSISQKLR